MNQDRQSGATVLNKLRVRHSRSDTGAAGLRISGAFAAADLRPASLSPATILVIRKLCDPLPGTLKFRGPDQRLPDAWRQATCVAIDQLSRRAYRPLLGPVPADAEAVIFLDRAELLACLAVDWCEGNLAARWWWACLFQLADARQLLLNEWLKAPEYVPMALTRLIEQGKVEAFLRQLPDDQTDLMLRAMFHTFGLAEIQNVLAATLWSAESLPPQALDRPQTATTRGRHLPQRMRAIAGWPVGGDEDLSGRSVAQNLLCLIGVMLVRRPATIRSTSFAKNLEAWLKASACEVEQVEDAEAIAELDQSRSQFTSDLNDRKPMPLRPVQPLNPEPLSSRTLKAGEGDEKPSFHFADPRALGKVNASEPFPDAQATVTEPGRLPIHSNDSEFPESEDSPASIDAVHPSETAGDQETQNSDCNHQNSISDDTTFYSEPASIVDVETGFGGLFYLINLALFLNLYGDFTSPMRPGPGLSIWDYLALVGEQLCGEQIKADGVWALLARLAERREDTPPGEDFEPPAAWRIPVDWLAPFPNREFCYEATEDQRLRVLHAEGFPIIDVPLVAGGNANEQLIHEMQNYNDVGKFTLRPVSSGHAQPPLASLNRWLGWLMAYQRARLLRALGLDDEGQLANRLLRHPGRISVTSMRLEVFFDLNQLPIEVRLSGLDRNPGWVPAAGRFIEFHFD
jgi:hypothetical protein